MYYSEASLAKAQPGGKCNDNVLKGPCQIVKSFLYVVNEDLRILELVLKIPNSLSNSSKTAWRYLPLFWCQYFQNIHTFGVSVFKFCHGNGINIFKINTLPF